MQKTSGISSWQLILMTMGSALVFPYTFMPILTAPPANQDAWIVLLMTGIYGVIISGPLLFIVNKFRGLSANAILEMVLGKFFGKAAALCYVLFFSLCYTACMLFTSLFIDLFIFPETPMWVILLYMVVPVLYAVLKGAETIGRVAGFIVVFILFTIVVFFLLGLGRMDFSILLPILADSTFSELNLGAFLTAARYSEITIIFVFGFYLQKNVSVNKVFGIGLSLFILAFGLILIPTLTTLGVEIGRLAHDPYFVYARQVSAYDFIERVHSLNTVAWFPAALLKLIIYNYMACHVLAGVLGKKSHKPFVIPITLAGASIAMLPIMSRSSTVEFLRSDQVFPFFVLPVTWAIPVILLLVYFIRRKKLAPLIEQQKQGGMPK